MEQDEGLRLPLLAPHARQVRGDDGLGSSKSPLTHMAEATGGFVIPADCEAPEESGTSVPSTVLNLSNIYVGIALLSMHYAVCQGGWGALGALAAAGAAFCFSAHLIVAAFDRLPPGVPRTYPELGHAAFGSGGVRMVLTLAALELAGSACLLLLVMWQLVQLFLPSAGLWGLSPLHTAVALVSGGQAIALLLPLRRLSWLSSIGSSASFAVAVVVVSLLAVDPHRTGVDQPPAGHHLFRPLGILQSTGIFCLSVSGHSTLPALRAAMARPQRFPTALKLAFALLLSMYGLVAGTGYWYFGSAASPLITTDLATHSFYSGNLDRVLSLLVAINAFCKYPPLVMCLQDMFLSRIYTTRRPRFFIVVALRLLLLAGCISISLAAYRIVGQTMSLLGGVASISCSMLMPVTFFLKLTWRRQSVPKRLGFLLLLAAGAAVMCLVTAGNIRDILRKHHHTAPTLAGGHELLPILPWLSTAT